MVFLKLVYSLSRILQVEVILPSWRLCSMIKSFLIKSDLSSQKQESRSVFTGRHMSTYYYSVLRESTYFVLTMSLILHKVCFKKEIDSDPLHHFKGGSALERQNPYSGQSSPRLAFREFPTKVGDQT